VFVLWQFNGGAYGDTLMRYKLVAGLFGLALLAGCEPSVHVVDYSNDQVTGATCDLDIYSQGLTVSESFKVIGEISVRDTGFSLNCGKEVVMSKIKTAACEANADAVQLFNVEHPSWRSSTCFQADGRFLKY